MLLVSNYSISWYYAIMLLIHSKVTSYLFVHVEYDRYNHTITGLFNIQLHDTKNYLNKVLHD